MLVLDRVFPDRLRHGHDRIRAMAGDGVQDALDRLEPGQKVSEDTTARDQNGNRATGRTRAAMP